MLNKLVISLTGSTGNMGRATLYEIVKLEEVKKIKLLVSKNNKRINKILKKIDKKYINKIEIVEGRNYDRNAVKSLVKDSNLVLNFAALIPPKSDKDPKNTIKTNVNGVKTIIEEIENIKENQPKLIHISSVAVYGNRTHNQMYAKVGDPLLASPLDIYTLTKVRSEFLVLESDIENWTIIRQSAMVHKNLLMDNIKDGLMFHTNFNGPLEWVSAEDCGILFKNIIKEEYKSNLNQTNFYKHVFNLGSGEKNQITGYNTLDLGFKTIGGDAKKFFKPNYDSLRNFHGVWFSDSLKLDNMFHYINDDYETYFKNIAKSRFYFKLAKIIPASIISSLIIKPLLKDENAPAYWVASNNEARIKATFYNLETYNKIGTDWKNFNLLNENKDYFGNTIDYKSLKTNKNLKPINYYFDIDKDEKLIDINDLNNVAMAHGGKLLDQDFKTGDIYRKLKWETQDGEIFEARPYTILKAGHRYSKLYYELVRDFDRLSKKDKIFAQIWYQDHKEDENNIYYLDENDDFKAKLKTF